MQQSLCLRTHCFSPRYAYSNPILKPYCFFSFETWLLHGAFPFFEISNTWCAVCNQMVISYPAYPITLLFRTQKNVTSKDNLKSRYFPTVNEPGPHRVHGYGGPRTLSAREHHCMFSLPGMYERMFQAVRLCLESLRKLISSKLRADAPGRDPRRLREGSE